MTDLAATLASVRDRIVRYRGQGIGEENTKTVLIEPVLRALGWDVEDLDEVRKEFRYKSGDNPVDYALFLLRTARLYVEAKALGENLEDRRWASQIMGYASVAGVEWVVLTDGNEYRIYNSHATVPVEEKLFRRVVIAADDPGTLDTLGLLSKGQLEEQKIEVLWRADFVDRQVRSAIEGLFAPEVPADFLHLLRKRVPALPVADVRASLARARFTLDYPAVPTVGPDAAAPRVPDPATAGAATPADIADENDGGADKTPWRHVTLRDLIASGAIQPPLDLETRYKGHQLTARIEPDGSVTWNGTRYDSLSTAAGMARKSVVGAPPGREYPQTNGWTFWRFRDAAGELAVVDVLRQRHAS
jgi:hypothetical protein